MAQDNFVKLPPSSAWQTELIRLTAFPSPSMNVANQNWWEELVGELPLKQKREPRSFEQSDEGPFKDGRLILNVSPLRVDWIYTVLEPNLNESKTKLLHLGTFDKIIKDFTDFIGNWVTLPNLTFTRLAFGSILLQEVDTHKNGYELVSAYLPFDLDPNNTSDFLYRINRKRSSKIIENLVINRLSTWAAISMRNYAFVTSSGRTIQQDISEPIYAARLELDVNTSPDLEGELPQEKITMIFDELVNLGIEIATKGDIP